MKTIGVTCTAVLSALLGTAALAFAVQEHPGEKQDHSQQQNSHEQAKPKQQQAQQQQNQGKQRQQAQQQQQTHQQQKQNQNKQQQQQARQQQNQNRQQQKAQQQQNQSRQRQQAQQQQRPQRTQEQQRVEQRAWQDHRARSWQSDHRTWQQRGGYNGYRIPQDRYRGYFGPQHWFRIYGIPFMVYGGYTRFQYQGYWITLLDPWPEYWSNNWYDNDDVYITYGNDGYYMYNRNYPGVGIAISISM